MFRSLFAALLAGALIAPTADSQLLTNGSFENPNINSLGFYSLYNSGSTGITGWTVLGLTGESIALTPDTFLGLQASQGRQWLDISGIYGYNKGMRSDAIAVTIGQTYRIGFDVGNLTVAGFGPATLGLAINGGAEQLFVNAAPITGVFQMNWQSFFVDWTADANTLSLDLVGRANGALGNDAGIGLDNVDVSLLGSSVPEPSTWALALTGLIAVGTVRRRRR